MRLQNYYNDNNRTSNWREIRSFLCSLPLLPPVRRQTRLIFPTSDAVLSILCVWLMLIIMKWRYSREFSFATLLFWSYQLVLILSENEGQFASVTLACSRLPRNYEDLLRTLVVVDHRFNSRNSRSSRWSIHHGQSIVFIQLGKQCLNDQWPPKPDRTLPTYVVNLDAPPIERWKDIADTFKAEVRGHSAVVHCLTGLSRWPTYWSILKHSSWRFHRIWSF